MHCFTSQQNMKKMGSKNFICSFFLILIAAEIFTQSASQTKINQWLKNSELKHVNIGISVLDIKSNKTQVDINASKAMIPASALKVIPSFLILEKFGKNFQFSTKIGYTGSIDKNGNLNGNLIISGSGDPSLGSGRFANFPDRDSLITIITQKIIQKNIKNVTGDLILHTGIFDQQNIIESWQFNDLSNYYASGAWGINFNENKYSIFLNTNNTVGKKVEVLYLDPKLDFLKIESECFIAPKGSGDKSYIIGAPNQLNKKITGTLPQSNLPYKIEGALPDPPSTLGLFIQRKLKSKGLNIKSVEIDKNFKPNYNIIHFDSIVSPKLSQIVREVNHRSLNTYCDAFLKMLGNYPTQQGKYPEGLNHIESQLIKAGYPSETFNIIDGSGLSSRSFITPYTLSHFIKEQFRKNDSTFIKYILPQTGKDGSVKNMLIGKNTPNSFWLKSGSMDNIQTFTGVCRTKSSKWVSITIMVNHYTMEYKKLKVLIEELLLHIYNEG